MWKTSVTCTTICSQIDRGIPFSVYPSSAPHPGRYTSFMLPGFTKFQQNPFISTRLCRVFWALNDSDKGSSHLLLAVHLSAEVNVLDRQGSILYFKTINWVPVPYSVVCVLKKIISRQHEAQELSHHFTERNEMLWFDILVVVDISECARDHSRRCPTKTKYFIQILIMLYALSNMRLWISNQGCLTF